MSKLVHVYTACQLLNEGIPIEKVHCKNEFWNTRIVINSFMTKMGRGSYQECPLPVIIIQQCNC